MGAKKLNTHEKLRLFCYTSSGSTKPKLHQDWGKIKRVCQRVWAGITPGYLTKLFESMPRRMEAVIKAGGDILNIRTLYIMIKVLSDLNK